MPKKITNPLRAGLPAKIYLLAFSNPISGYRIAQLIYNKGYAPTSKIYQWTKKLVKQEIISQTNEGFFSNTKPLLTEIEKALKSQNLTLSEFENYVLQKVLDSKEFRHFLNEEVIKKTRMDQDIDAAKIILESLGLIASSSLFSFKMAKEREPDPKTKKEFDQRWKRITTRPKEETEKMINEAVEETKESFKRFNLKEFSPTDKELLKQNYFLWMKFEPFLAVPKGTWEKLTHLFPFADALQSFTYNLFTNMAVFLNKYTKKQAEKEVKK